MLAYAGMIISDDQALRGKCGGEQSPRSGPGPLVGPAAVPSRNSPSFTEDLPKGVTFQLGPGGGRFKQKEQQEGAWFCHPLVFVTVVDSESGEPSRVSYHCQTVSNGTSQTGGTPKECRIPHAGKADRPGGLALKSLRSKLKGDCGPPSVCPRPDPQTRGDCVMSCGKGELKLQVALRLLIS